ncbi:hypothetical protein CRG98_049243, partial [Punica granatum]
MTGETALDLGGVKEYSAFFRRIRPRGLLDPPWVMGGFPRWFGPFLAYIMQYTRD